MGQLRYFRRVSMALVLGLVIAAAALYAFRLSLTERVVSGYLRDVGVSGRLHVTRLDLAGARIEDVSLDGIEAVRIEIAWDLSLAHGFVPTHITVQGPSLVLDLTGERQPFETLRDAVKGSGGGRGGAGLPAVPRVDLEDGRAEIVTQRGSVTARFNLESEPREDGSSVVRGSLAADGLGFSGKSAMEAILDGTRPTGFRADLEMWDLERPDRVTARLEGQALGSELKVTMDLAGEVSATPLIRAGLIPGAVEGTSRFNLSGEAYWPDFVTDNGWPGMTVPDRLAAIVGLRADELAWAGRFSGGALDWSGKLSWKDTAQKAVLTQTRPLELELGRVEDQVLPAPLIESLASGALSDLFLSLDAPAVTVAPEARQITIPEARIDLKEHGEDRISANGDLTVSLSEDPSVDLCMNSRIVLPRSLRQVSDLEGSGSACLSGSLEDYVLRLRDRLSLSFEPVPSSWPQTFAFLRGSPIRFDASADGEEGSFLVLHAAGGGRSVEFHGRAALSSRIADSLEIDGQASGTLREENLQIQIPEIRLAATGIERSALKADRVGAVASGKILFRDGLPSGSARFRLDPAELLVAQDRISLGGGMARFSRDDRGPATLELDLESLSADDRAVSVVDIGLSALWGPSNRARIILRNAKVEDLWLPKRFSPLDLSGGAALAEDRVTAEVSASPSGGGEAALGIDLAYDPDSGSGLVEFAGRDLDFSGRFQPADILPSLKILKNVEGDAQLEGQVFFDRQGLIDSRGQVGLALSRLESDGLRIEGVATSLELSSLWPVESPPGQRITISRVAKGSELKDVAVGYRLAPRADGPPLLEIEQASMELLGGTLRVGRTVYDPDGNMETAIVEVDDLDLVAVLSLISSEGLAGEGRLQGRFPVRLEGGALVVENARLEAESPGVIRFDSPEAAAAMGGAGDHVNLLLDALKNFHYQELALAGDKAAGGDITLLLSLSGHNPDVLEGYPFNINIKLQTDAAPLLGTFRQGTDLFDELVERVWRSGTAIR